MSTFRLCVFASLFALGACSATPVPIPFADGGLPAADTSSWGGVDGTTSGDAAISLNDGGPGPPPCGDGGDATCGDVGLSDAVGEGALDGGLDAGAEDAIYDDTLHEGMGQKDASQHDKGRRDAGFEEAGGGDTLGPDL